MSFINCCFNIYFNEQYNYILFIIGIVTVSLLRYYIVFGRLFHHYTYIIILLIVVILCVIVLINGPANLGFFLLPKALF